MNILYCGDQGITDGIIISVLSLIKHTDRVLQIYVLTMRLKGYQPVTEKLTQVLDREVKRKNHRSFVKLVDVTAEYQKDRPKANQRNLFTPYCLLRLYADAPELNLPDKILYLDTDVVAMGDPWEMYKIDNSQYELTGVLDYYGGWMKRDENHKKNYINSGVLLMNLKLIRETGMFTRAREMCRTRKMLLPDQTALNFCTKHKKIVGARFNEQHQENNRTIFRHFSNTLHLFPIFHVQKIKPWHIEKLHNVLKCYKIDDVLERYLKIKKELK